MVNKLISIKSVISKIVRDLGLDSKGEIPYQDMIEWVVEGIQFIGAYPQYEKKVEQVKITNYVGDLPCDLYKMIGIIDGVCFSDYNPALIGTNEEDLKLVSITSKDYNITHNKITIASKTGSIRVQYLAIPLDDCNLPLVPDEVSVFQALLHKVAYYLAWRAGDKQEREYNEIRWRYYCGQARATLNMPDAHGMERLANSWNRLIPGSNEYSNLYRSLGLPENLDRS